MTAELGESENNLSPEVCVQYRRCAAGWVRNSRSRNRRQVNSHAFTHLQEHR